MEKKLNIQTITKYWDELRGWATKVIPIENEEDSFFITKDDMLKTVLDNNKTTLEELVKEKWKIN